MERDGWKGMDGKGWMERDSYLAATLVVVVVCRVLDTWRMGETYIFFVINYPLQLTFMSPSVCVLSSLQLIKSHSFVRWLRSRMELHIR
jgi:hypothetical protein